MAMKKCPSCGQEVDATAKFCTSCGTALPDAPAAVTPEQSAPQQAAPVQNAADQTQPAAEQNQFTMVPPTDGAAQPTPEQNQFTMVPPEQAAQGAPQQVPDQYTQVAPVQQQFPEQQYQQMPMQQDPNQYQQANPYQQGAYPYQNNEQAPKGSSAGMGLAIACLACGVISVILCFFVTPIVPLILGVASIVLFVLARKYGGSNGMRVGGLVTGLIGLIVSLIRLIILIACMAALSSVTHGITNSIGGAISDILENGGDYGNYSDYGEYGDYGDYGDYGEYYDQIQDALENIGDYLN